MRSIYAVAFKRVIFGKHNDYIAKLKDINYLEGSILLTLCILSLVFGFLSRTFFNTMDVSVNEIIYNHQNELAVNLIGKN